MGANYLTDEDVAVLKAIVAREKKRPPGLQPLRGPVDPQAGQEGGTPELYLAHSPGGGIASLGHADCDIWKVHVDGSGTYSQVQVAELQRRVYNPFSSAIAGSTLIAVNKDKFGTWIPQMPASGTAGGSIGFVKYVSTDTLHQLILPNWNQSTSYNMGGASVDGWLAASPFIMPACSIDRLAVFIASPGATGDVIRLGIYRAGANVLPDALVCDSGNIAVDLGASGWVEATVSATLTAGQLYWAAVRLPVYAYNGGIGPGSLLIPSFSYATMPYVSTIDNPLGISRSGLEGSLTDMGVGYARIGRIKVGLGAVAALPDPFSAGGEFILGDGSFEVSVGMGNHGTPVICARLA